MKQKWPYLCLLIAPLFWGGNFTVGRAVLDDLPPITLSLLRWLVALLVLVPFAWPELVRNGRQYLKHWKEISGLGLLGVSVFSVMVYVAIEHTTAINAGLLAAWGPLMVVIVSYLVLGDKINGKQLVGIAMAFVGVMWIVSKGSWARLAAFTPNLGDVLMIAANVIWAFYSILVRKTAAILPGVIGFTLSTAAGVLFLIPGAAWEMSVREVHIASWDVIAGVVYLGVFASVVSFLCYNVAIRHLGPNTASSCLNLVPVAATVYAVLFLGEQLQMAQAIGGMFILAGVLLTSHRGLPVRQRKPAEASAATNVQV